jgi:hypothetical protein
MKMKDLRSFAQSREVRHPPLNAGTTVHPPKLLRKLTPNSKQTATFKIRYSCKRWSLGSPYLVGLQKTQIIWNLELEKYWVSGQSPPAEYNFKMLTVSQLEAIKFVSEYAKSRKLNAVSVIDHILRMSDVTQSEFQTLINETKSKMRVAFHFHPDRLDPDMKTVAESLLASGIYKSQFETLLSSGSVSARPGGARDLWEKQLFGGSYHHARVDNSQRPKYGALDLLAHPDGPSPRFGSCYLLSKPEVSQRCTFTYRDSHQDPEEKGTFEEFEDIVAALLSDSFSDEIVLGEQLRPARLLKSLAASANKTFEERLVKPHRRILDHYIEAQVHGTVSLSDDIESLVADPSFKGTEVGRSLNNISTKFGVALKWHAGFMLKVSDVPSDFRGRSMPTLANRVAPNGNLDTKMIGDSAASLRKNPNAWADRGTEKDVLQELKLLWHVLLRYGEPLT